MVEETAVVGAAIQSWFPNVAAAFSFLVFNLLDSPCLAAIATMAQQMQSRKWFWFAVLYQNVFAYGVSLCVYQLGSVILGAPAVSYTHLDVYKRQVLVCHGPGKSCWKILESFKKI